MQEYSVKLLSPEVAEIKVADSIAGYLIAFRTEHGMIRYRMLDACGTPLTDNPFGGFTISVHKIVSSFFEN